MADPHTSDPRPIASLTPRLLARKGGAKPAMRPQASALAVSFDEAAQDDLGWNDMGHDHDANPRGEVVSIDSAGRMQAHVPAIVRQQRGLSHDLNAERSSALAAGRRAAFTLRVLALASQKGGSGKTTLSGHLAVQAQRAGAGPVVLIDIDPQGSLADWWNEREAEFPSFAQTTVARLAADLAVLRQQGFRLAVIDTPPAITMAIQSVISVAELIVVPTRPSPHDLRAVGATVDLCERAGKPLIFVVNAATPKAKITSEAAVALSQHGTVAPITLHHRAAIDH